MLVVMVDTIKYLSQVNPNLVKKIATLVERTEETKSGVKYFVLKKII